MKKLLLSLFFLLSFLSLQAKDNVVSKDTIEYNGYYELKKNVKQNNQTGEISVSYFVILKDFNNKKVTVSKKTFDKGKIKYVVYIIIMKAVQEKYHRHFNITDEDDPDYE